MSVSVNVNKYGGDPVAEIAAAGFSGIRIPAHRDLDISDYLRQAHGLGLSVILVLDRDSFEWDDWKLDYWKHLRRYLLDYGPLLAGVQIGNEPDNVYADEPDDIERRRHESVSSWVMTRAEFGELLFSVGTSIGAWNRDKGLSIRRIAGGLDSGQPSFLEGVDLTQVDELAVHAYAQTADTVGSLLGNYARFGKPVRITEWGQPSDWSEESQATESARMVEWCAPNGVELSYFHWRGDPFGLIAADGRERPVFEAVRTALAALPASVEPPEEPSPMTEYEAFCRAEAARRGIDPDVAVRAANTEGGLTEPARRGTFNTGSSWWAFQLHYGGAGTPYEYLGTVAGMGNTFTAVTGWAPGDPNAWRDAMRFALDQIRGGGWGPWYGPRNIGITGFVGVDRSVPWGGTPDAEWDYRQTAPTPTLPAPTPPIFDPEFPAFAQNDPWSCAPTAARWALWAIGRHTSEAWLEQAVQDAGVANPQVGLTDGSGAKLAAFLNDQYAGEPGPAVHAGSAYPVSFDDVAAAGGHHPQLIGSTRWGSEGHWSGVRGYDRASDSLLLANPASGHGNVFQEMSRTQWDSMAPFACVWIDAVPKTGEVAPPEPPPGPDAAELQAQIEQLTKERARLIEGLAYVGDDLMDRVQSVIDEVRSVRTERVGPRPA